jgi:hypothetical protein
LVRSSVDQQVGWLTVDASGHDHFVHRSVVHPHGFVSGQVHTGAILRCGKYRKRRDREED